MNDLSEKYKGKYRIASARLQGWDYGWNAAYFVTICTQDRVHYFGDVKDGIMELSAIGELADLHWREIPERFSYAKLGQYIIMPNHMHGIVIIDKPDGTVGVDGIGNYIGRDAINRVSTNNNTNINDPNTTPPSKKGGITGDKNPMLHDNLSRIIRWYKGRVTYEVRRLQNDFDDGRSDDPPIGRDAINRVSTNTNNTPFKWQPRFYDHIIRDEQSFQRISTYILSNPANWKNDKLYEP